MLATQEQAEAILMKPRSKDEALRLLLAALNRRLDKATDDDVLKAARAYAKAWPGPRGA